MFSEDSGTDIYKKQASKTLYFIDFQRLSFCGMDETRTRDLLRDRQMVYVASYWLLNY